MKTIGRHPRCVGSFIGSGATVRLIPCGFIFALFLLNSAAQNSTPQPAADKLADGPGKRLVERACLSCHAVRVVISKRASEDEWADEVDKMVARGAILTDDEADQVIEYLATHYGPDKSSDKSSTAPETNGQPPSAQSSDTGKAAPSPSPETTAPLNVNQAGAQELESSLGLSEKEAEAIVQYRGRYGNFKTLQDLLAVPDVPQEKIRNNQRRLAF